MPDCWLEVSLRPEGPATVKLDRGFQLFSSILQHFMQIPYFVSCSTCPSPDVNIKIFVLVQPFHCWIKISVLTVPSKFNTKIAIICSKAPVQVLCRDEVHFLTVLLTRRTNVHCLGTFKGRKFVCTPPVTLRFVPLLPPKVLLFSLFLLQRLKLKFKLPVMGKWNYDIFQSTVSERMVWIWEFLSKY
jgi:hypothetical protein